MIDFNNMSFEDINRLAYHEELSLNDIKTLRSLGVLKTSNRNHICLSCRRLCYIRDELVGYGEDVTNCVYYKGTK